MSGSDSDSGGRDGNPSGHGGPPPPPGPPPGGARPELHRALGDLESAMRRLAGSAQREWSDRAVDAIDDATRGLHRAERRRLRKERRRARRDGYGDDGYDAYGARGGQGFADDAGPGDPRDDDSRGRRRRRRRVRLVRVPGEGIIAGVCAGLARRMGIETWLVRCMAVTGMLFLPQVIGIAYIVMCFRMRPVSPAEAETAYAAHFGSIGTVGGRQPIAGFDRGISASERLHTARVAFDAMEQRLRRIEGYVTSSRFELDRELNKIDT